MDSSFVIDNALMASLFVRKLLVKFTAVSNFE